MSLLKKLRAKISSQMTFQEEIVALIYLRLSLIIMVVGAVIVIAFLVR